jgi:hypothetical protein
MGGGGCTPALGEAERLGEACGGSVKRGEERGREDGRRVEGGGCTPALGEAERLGEACGGSVKRGEERGREDGRRVEGGGCTPALGEAERLGEACGGSVKTATGCWRRPALVAEWSLNTSLVPSQARMRNLRLFCDRSITTQRQ